MHTFLKQILKSSIGRVLASDMMTRRIGIIVIVIHKLAHEGIRPSWTARNEVLGT